MNKAKQEQNLVEQKNLSKSGLKALHICWSML